MVKTVDPLENAETAQYDNAGNLVRTVDANGTVSDMGYDMLGRKISERIAGSGATINRSYAFDSIGCMTSVIEDSAVYTYDGQNRLKTATYSDGTKDVFTFDDSRETFFSEKELLSKVAKHEKRYDKTVKKVLDFKRPNKAVAEFFSMCNICLDT